MKYGSFQLRFTTVSLLNRQSSQLLTVLSWSSYACEKSYPWNTRCLCVHVFVFRLKTQLKKWHFNSIIQNESTVESKEYPNFGSESQVYPSHSNMYSAMMVIFTLFEILYYGRYFQLPLLNTQY